MYFAVSSHFCIHLACSGEEHLIPFSERRCSSTEPALERAEHRRDEGGRMLTLFMLTLWAWHQVQTVSRSLEGNHHSENQLWSCTFHTNDHKNYFTFMQDPIISFMMSPYSVWLLLRNLSRAQANLELFLLVQEVRGWGMSTVDQRKVELSLLSRQLQSCWIGREANC